MYYRKCDGIIIIYDVTNKESFDRINYWVKTINDNTDSNKKIHTIIVGNKIDLDHERKILEEEGKKMAEAYSLKYFETSAKENIGINEFMKIFIKDIINEKDKPNDEKNNETIQLENRNKNEAQNWLCCG